MAKKPKKTKPEAVTTPTPARPARRAATTVGVCCPGCGSARVKVRKTNTKSATLGGPPLPVERVYIRKQYFTCEDCGVLWHRITTIKEKDWQKNAS